MALRKAGAYSKRYARPYTRKSNVKSKSYIKTVPPSKIVKLEMGDVRGFYDKKYGFVLRLVSKQKVQLRDNALESARQVIHKILETSLLGQFYFAIKVYPHHILRENKMLTGAGSDRMQTGMQRSFGKTVGRAAFVASGQDIFVVGVNTEKSASIVKNAFLLCKAKLPCSTKIVMEKIDLAKQF